MIDADSGLAPWRQALDQIVRMIVGGGLPPDTRLPPIRQLARDLGLDVHAAMAAVRAAYLPCS